MVKKALSKIAQSVLTSSEYEIQRDIFAWAEVANGKYRGLDLMYATGSGLRLPVGLLMKAKRMGIIKKGLPDIVLPVARKGYHGLYIELKTDKGKPSADQVIFIKRLIEEGYFAITCKGFDEAIKMIIDYMD